MKSFVDLKITGEQFVSQFSKLHRSNEEAVKFFETNPEQLNTFKLNPKFSGLTKWTSEINLCCDEFYPDFQPQDQVEFAFARDEENLRTVVANVIPELQKYF